MEAAGYSTIFSTTKVRLFSLAYLAALAGAEFLVYYKYPVWGIILHFAIIFGLIFLGAISKDQAQSKLWVALGLAPLIRIVSLAMPVLPQISQFIWYIIISIPIIAAIITISRANKYSPDEIGLNFKKPVIQIMVIIAGIGLAFADYYILKPSPMISNLSLQTVIFPALVLLIFTGFVEELAFRGVMQKATGEFGYSGIILIAVIYALMQIGQGSALHCLFAFGVSLLFGLAVKRTGSVVGVGAAHGILNIGLYLIVPYLV